MSLQLVLQAGAVTTALLLQGSLADTDVDNTAADVEKAKDFYAEPWTGICATGTNLSPIDVQETTQADPTWTSDFGFTSYAGVSSHSTGHSLQMLWGDAIGESTAAVQARGSDITDLFQVEGELTTMRVTPLQMHWHSPSEHAINGVFFAAEGHIVSAIAEGEAPPDWGCDLFWQTGNASDLVLEKCIAVFGVLYSLGDTTEPALFSQLIANQPLEVGATNPLNMSVDIASFLPERKDYITYRGSLTTPECNQGLRWHLFDEPMTITADDQMQLLQNQADQFLPGAENDTLTYKANTQYIQPLNDRTVFRIGEAGSIASAQTAATADDGVEVENTEADAPVDADVTVDSSATLSKVQAGLVAVAALALYML